jgi:hypothetical protein
MGYTRKNLKLLYHIKEDLWDGYGVTGSLRTVMNASRVKIEKDWRGVKQMLKDFLKQEQGRIE